MRPSGEQSSSPERVSKKKVLVELPFRSSTKRYAGRKNNSGGMAEALHWDEASVANGTTSSKCRPRRIKTDNVYFNDYAGKRAPAWRSEQQEQFVEHDLDEARPIIVQYVIEDDGEPEETSDEREEIASDSLNGSDEKPTQAKRYQVSVELPKLQVEKVEKEQDERNADDAVSKRNKVTSKKKPVRPVDVKEEGMQKHPATAKSSARDRVKKDFAKKQKNGKENAIIQAIEEEELREEAQGRSGTEKGSKPIQRKKATASTRNMDAQRASIDRIKQKWSMKQLDRLADKTSDSRGLPDTSVSMFDGRPPFTNFGEKNVNPIRGGIVYDSYMLSHNVTPELYPNEPDKLQTYTGAIERAIIGRGALNIGCQDRIKLLRDTATRKNILRRRMSMVTLQKSRRKFQSKVLQSATCSAEQIKEYFVPLSAR